MSSKPQALGSTGPMRAFAANSKKVSTELIEINESLLQFNKFVTEYYKQLAETWNDAQKKVNLKAPEVPQDVEQMDAFKRIENYGKLVSKELELTKHWNNITNVILQSVNLPSKEEIDEVYKELHSLKKRVTKLEIEAKKKKEMKKNE
jgi:phosphoenolpyruvate carboxylase